MLRQLNTNKLISILILIWPFWCMALTFVLSSLINLSYVWYGGIYVYTIIVTVSIFVPVYLVYHFTKSSDKLKDIPHDRTRS